jgi:hypothetical protein
LGASSRAGGGLAPRSQTARLASVVCTRREPRIESVRRERPLPPGGRSRGPGGGDGLAFRTGQLRLTRARPTRWRRRSRIDRPSPRQKLFEGQRLSAPRVMDRPRLVGWSSLHRARRQSLTFLVAIAGTATAGSRTDGEAPARPRPPPRRTLRYDASTGRNAFHRVATPSGSPRPSRRASPSEWRARAPRAPFSPRSRRAVRQHGLRRAPRPAPRRRFALRLLERRDARCVGPISAISRLRTSTRASSIPVRVQALSRRRDRGAACSTAVPLASAGRHILSNPPRRAFCSRRDA